MRLRLFATLAIALSFALVGCKDQPAGSAASGNAAKPTPQAVSIAAIEATAQGFSVGVPMSARPVYVFFDAQCPHCTALWEAAKPLKSKTRFVWIPVGILNAASVSQGATILASAQPEAAMDAHEASMRAKAGGISAAGNIDAQKAAIEKSTQLLSSFGFGSIPTIVTTHAQTGALITQEGSMSTEALASFLGL
jgi:thiol:disulfide interchange protein DsbG